MPKKGKPIKKYVHEKEDIGYNRIAVETGIFFIPGSGIL